jgi:hypothetical protein
VQSPGQAIHHTQQEHPFQLGLSSEYSEYEYIAIARTKDYTIEIICELFVMYRFVCRVRNIFLTVSFSPVDPIKLLLSNPRTKRTHVPKNATAAQFLAIRSWCDRLSPSGSPRRSSIATYGITVPFNCGSISISGLKKIEYTPVIHKFPRWVYSCGND